MNRPSSLVQSDTRGGLSILIPVLHNSVASIDILAPLRGLHHFPGNLQLLDRPFKGAWPIGSKLMLCITRMRKRVDGC